MGIYVERRDKLAARINELAKRISDDTAKKQELEVKYKEVSRLAMAEEYNCKPRELDEIINSEHTLLQKLRASGLSDSELLEMVGITVADNGSNATGDNSNVMNNENADSSDGNADNDSTAEADEIRFYGQSDNDED